jgi:hypothetical protein
MDITEIQTAKNELSQKILALLQEFEKMSGLPIVNIELKTATLRFPKTKDDLTYMTTYSKIADINITIQL